MSDERIWIAGHRGMVGSALTRLLQAQNRRVLTVDRAALDLRRQQDVETWIKAHRPTAIILAAAFLVSVRVQRLDSPIPDERALTLGMFIALVAPVAPIGEAHHYVTVFPAVFIAWWWMIRTSAQPAPRIALAVFTLLLCAPQRYYGSPLIADGWKAVLAYPLVCGAFGIWAVLVRTLLVAGSDPSFTTSRT